MKLKFDLKGIERDLGVTEGTIFDHSMPVEFYPYSEILNIDGGVDIEVNLEPAAGKGFCQYLTKNKNDDGYEAVLDYWFRKYQNSLHLVIEEVLSEAKREEGVDLGIRLGDQFSREDRSILVTFGGKSYEEDVSILHDYIERECTFSCLSISEELAEALKIA